MLSLLSIALQPATEPDRLKLDQALQQLRAEDPSIAVETSEEDGAIGGVVILGRGELHLEIIAGRLKQEFGIEVCVGRPRVVYKETLTREADGEMKYARQTGGRGQYGHVKIHVYPGGPGTGLTFTNGIADGAIPNEFIASIEEGIREALMHGVLAGYPVDDVRIELCGGSYHDVDSSKWAFRIAGSMAVQDAAKKARPVLLEPVMRVDVTIPAEHLDEVLEDMAQRRALIVARNESGGARIVSALVPLHDILRYATDLRKRTSGRGTYVMQFDHYQPVQHTEDDADRDSFVGAPRKPFSPLRSSRMSVPEPEEDGREI